MARAIQLARQGWYTTSPNPRVGCVLVKEGKIIAEGWHEQAGCGHAEIQALASAQEPVTGAIAYVTLEPCSHHGKTPPCADALIKAGIKTVVYGMQDPNPQVAGQGLARLQAAGIDVTGPVLEQDCRALNPGFIQRMETGRPRVFAKVASSLDGRTAMQSGESQWITGSAARADVQKLRAQSCAIVTGVGTVMQDNPLLTVRDESLAIAGLPLRQPLRVIVDSHLQTPEDAAILHQPGKSLLVYAEATPAKLSAMAAMGLETVCIANAEGKVDLQKLLVELGRRQCNEVMLESGAKLLGAFLQAQLVDELYLYMAPTLLGSSARPLAALPLENMSQQLRFDVKDMRNVGDDIRWQLALRYYDQTDNP
jgi:diaminohydroxyphosphoribosylaminopyrimidine deaminase/5-amino-6-(5-phosphoribosylamino)uracil reductase